jgi:hypothetical protein
VLYDICSSSKADTCDGSGPSPHGISSHQGGREKKSELSVREGAHSWTEHSFGFLGASLGVLTRSGPGKDLGGMMG